MKKVFCGFFVLAMFSAAQGHASGCDSTVYKNLGKKLKDVSATGSASCWESNGGLFHCDFKHDGKDIPVLIKWLKPTELPELGIPIQTTIEVYEALLYSDCNGPDDMNTPPNGYFYKALINGFQYEADKFK